ncbi:FAD-dependent thymidylate synthase [Paenibacillus sp. NPDC058177]|uniref:FAD-dependent thymidylate synthase n=1 Tax=Paenibacillus sp. NPDC058177 TaxID=3346369 RepID=UPI0036DC1A47
METRLVYSTPDYHKLVEYIALRCYDDFEKSKVEIHKLMRDIMKKEHMNIINHGNIVFTISSVYGVNYHDILDSLVSLKEYNNNIRWSRDPQSNWDFVISLNILSFIDLSLSCNENKLLQHLMNKLFIVPSLRWFVENTYQIEGSDNPYLQNDTDHLQPTVLSSDYIALKELGLTDYELEMHTTVTVEIVSDRAMLLQDACHSDMLGRSEISQRNVSMSDFKYYVPTGLSNTDVIYSEADGLIQVTYGDIMHTIALSYDKVMAFCESRGDSKLRAKELASSILPNAIYSRYIETRPLKQWKHLFKLRDDVHTLNEKQKNAQALLTAFRRVGVPV